MMHRNGHNETRKRKKDIANNIYCSSVLYPVQHSQFKKKKIEMWEPIIENLLCSIAAATGIQILHQ
uniref:Uncharacterized protein n=1 Tax=Arundo donax TaxID=35708 RepID=A0A0A8YF96_ARUDO